MRHEVNVPQQGLTTEYVTIGDIYVNVGDTVSIGMALCNMESEKAVLDLESPVDGTVEEILKNTGDEADIGEPVFIIEG